MQAVTMQYNGLKIKSQEKKKSIPRLGPALDLESEDLDSSPSSAMSWMHLDKSLHHLTHLQHVEWNRYLKMTELTSEIREFPSEFIWLWISYLRLE